MCCDGLLADMLAQLERMEAMYERIKAENEALRSRLQVGDAGVRQLIVAERNGA